MVLPVDGSTGGGRGTGGGLIHAEVGGPCLDLLMGVRSERAGDVVHGMEGEHVAEAGVGRSGDHCEEREQW
jgi:hypothetical protein